MSARPDHWISEEMTRALRGAGVRPPENADRSEKKNYAERLSRSLAQEIADALRKKFPGIAPLADGTRQESKARSAKGPKKLDVNHSTSELGLGLGVSVKTVNYRDPRTKRYTKNYTRIDNELRAEASDYHRRQPYAVLVAVLFLPADACDDGATRQASSFGGAVRALRRRAGRRAPKNDVELFERIFVGLYAVTDVTRASVRFFDVDHDPPFHGPPSDDRCLTWKAWIREIGACYDDRNDPPFRWAASP